MKRLERSIAAAEVVLIFPAVLFMTALFVRNLQPQQYQPAHAAQSIVDWFAARTHLGLWVLLIALPLAVLVIGAATLRANWRKDAELRQAARTIFVVVRNQWPALLVAVTTLTAAGILATVALHVLTD